MTRLLVIMGSGETAPTMVTPHRELVALLTPPPRPAEAVLLETPYGFQENAEDISAKARAYFAGSVGLQVSVPPGLRAPAAGGADRDTDRDTDRGLAAVQAARWLFAGPGSPTYALRQWQASPMAAALHAHLRRDGITIFSSAAACTVGRFALPVYEVYKVGLPPVWQEGLDLAGDLGLPAAVVPHYDNAEGGNHDTRFCYMGERRLALLEAQLPPEVGILGVDEHTAAILDLDAATLRVTGRGGVTLRHRGRSQVLPAGAGVGFAELAALLSGAGEAIVTTESSTRKTSATEPRPPAGLAAEVRDREAEFERAAAAGDGVAMAGAALDLDRLILAWSADTLQSDELDRAHAVLRGMLVRLGEAAGEGLRDPAERLAPLVDPLVRLRRELRAGRSFAVADQVRAALDAAGVQLRDGAEGTTWQLVGTTEG